MAESQIVYEKFGEGSGETPRSRIQEIQCQAPGSVMTGNHKNNNMQVFYILGITECVLGGLMSILAITSLCLNATLYGDVYDDYLFTNTAQGLWGGILVAKTGIHGILSKKYPSACMYNGNMAMIIVTAVLQPAVITLSRFALVTSRGGNILIHNLIGILSFAAMVVCIIHSIYCCIGNCCRNGNHQDVASYVSQPSQQTDQISGESSRSNIQEVVRQASRLVMTGDHGNNNVEVLFILGIAECVLAGLMILLAITTMPLMPLMGFVDGVGSTIFTYSAQGLWGGVLVAATGILGILTKKYPSVRMYNANMAMSIVTAVLQTAVVILSGFAAVTGLRANFAIHLVIEGLSFAVMVVCIIHSIYCCTRNCCGKRKHEDAVSYVPQKSQQIEQLPNAHYRMDNGNPASRQQDLTSMAIASTTTANASFESS